jgi:POT family proton-dependent oligopeptide transporter
MTLGLIFYLSDQRRLGRVGLLAEPPRNAARQWLGIAGAVLALVLVFYVFWPYRHYAMILGAIAVFGYLLKRGGETPMERRRIGAVALLFVFATLFWAGFEQAGSSLTLFADQVTHNQAFGWEFPSSWYQLVQPMFVILLAPVMALLWLRLGSRDPSSPTKFLIALVLLALSFGVVALASQHFAQSGHKVSPWWLVLVYLLHAIGELSLSPVGLSSTTKLAPAKIVGFVMGVWFLSNSLGNFFAGEAAAYFDKVPLPELFGTMGAIVAGAAVLLLLLVRPIRNLMSGIN